MKTIKISDIQWDTETDFADENETPPNLPKEVVLEVADDFDINEQTADMLSDIYGYCVFSCNVKIK